MKALNGKSEKWITRFATNHKKASQYGVSNFNVKQSITVINVMVVQPLSENIATMKTFFAETNVSYDFYNFQVPLYGIVIE